jgi:hypothetical protein
VLRYSFFIIKLVKPRLCLFFNNLIIVEAKGGKIEYLPPYSPDLNPVEKLCSKVKGYLRKVKELGEEALFEAIGAALRAVTAQDAQGWFEYCGYYS